jgi:hypothetical protein
MINIIKRLLNRQSPVHFHVWKFEMDGPMGMDRDCCEDQNCRARRYRGMGSSLVEDDGRWKASPPRWATKK